MVARTRTHLSLVDPHTIGQGSIESIGPYSVRGPLADHGHPDILLAWRDEPPALAGPYALLPFEKNPARLPTAETAMLRNAARAMAARHPAIVRVRDLVGEAQALAIVTERVEGTSIETILTRAGARPLERDVAIAVTATLLEALADIHAMPRERGRHALPAAHGDVRARNVVLTPDGSVRLLGFGLPLARDAFRLEQPDDVEAGTVTSDELWFPTPHGDQFAAGLLLLRMLSIDGDGLSLSRGHGPVPSRVRSELRRFDLADPLLPALLKLLASRPEHRYATADRAAEELRQLQDEAENFSITRFAARLLRDDIERTDVGIDLDAALRGADGADEGADLITDGAILAPDLDDDSVPTARVLARPSAPAEVGDSDPLALSVTAPSEGGPLRPAETAAARVASQEITSWRDGHRDDEQTSAPGVAVQPTADRSSWEVEEASIDLDDLASLADSAYTAPPHLTAPQEDDDDDDGILADVSALDRPENEWTSEPEEEGVRTVPAGASFERRRPPAAVSEPGRTVPYSPAFVPRATKWLDRDRDRERGRAPRDHDLDRPWVAGLLSGSMDAITRDQVAQRAPDSVDALTRPQDGALAPRVPDPEDTAVPAPRPRPGAPAPSSNEAPAHPDARPKRARKTGDGSGRKRRAKRSSAAPPPPGMNQLLKDSWVLTLFTVTVMALFVYSGWQIWLRTRAPVAPEPSPVLQNLHLDE